MTRLPGQLAERGIDVELHMVGDKIQADPSDPLYPRRMEKALRGSPGVVWHGGLRARRRHDRRVVPTSASAGGTASSTRAWSCRRRCSSTARSVCRSCSTERRCTKRCSASTTRCSPSSEDDVVDAIEAATATGDLRATRPSVARGRGRGSPRRGAVERVRRLLDGSTRRTARSPVADASAADRGRQPRPQVLLPAPRAVPVDARARGPGRRVAGARSSTTPNRARSWSTGPTSSSASGAGRTRSGTAKHKRTDQRLFVRLHRFELYRPWPEQLAIDERRQDHLRLAVLRAARPSSGPAGPATRSR